MSAPAMNVVPAPIEHDGVGRRIGDGARDRLIDRLPHAGAERVHRRVVDGEDGDAVPDLVVDELVHVTAYSRDGVRPSTSGAAGPEFAASSLAPPAGAEREEE